MRGLRPIGTQVTRARGAVGASSLADFRKAEQTACGLADGPGRCRGRLHHGPHLETGDIVIDGGNSYYIDDIRRGRELNKAKLRRRGYQRWRLGSGTRLLPDDRRSSRGREASRPNLRDAGARHRQIPARRDVEGLAAPRKRATSTAARAALATSSRWCTTASNTA